MSIQNPRNSVSALDAACVLANEAASISSGPWPLFFSRLRMRVSADFSACEASALHTVLSADSEQVPRSF